MDSPDDLPLFTYYHSHDPETSREAIESIADRLTSLQGAVLDALREAGPTGLADFQLAALFPQASYSTYRTRRGELVKQGLVRDTGRRTFRLGSPRRHVVWALAEFTEARQENASE